MKCVSLLLLLLLLLPSSAVTPAADNPPAVAGGPEWNYTWKAAPGEQVTAEISRRHNNLNVLCLSADMLSPRTVERMVEVWISTPFEGGRHERRIEKITLLEKELGVGGH